MINKIVSFFTALLMSLHLVNPSASVIPTNTSNTSNYQSSKVDLERQLFHLQINNQGGLFNSEIKSLTNQLVGFFHKLGADAFQFVGGQKFRLAGSGLATTDTSITLQSFTFPVSGTEITMSDFGGVIGYGTIEPNTSKKEFISFTGISQDASSTQATLTGVTRALKFNAPYNQDTTLAQTHSGGVIFVISNSPQFYNQLVSKLNDETISGQFTFSSTTHPKYDSSPGTFNLSDLIDKNYADGLVAAGVATATEATFGGVKLASSTSAALSVASSSSAIGAAPLVLLSRYASTTRCQNTNGSPNYCIPVTQSNGRINGDLLDTTFGFNFTSSTTVAASFFVNSASSTLNSGTGTTTISGLLNITGPTTTWSGVTYVPPLTASSTPYASSSVLTATPIGNGLTALLNWRQMDTQTIGETILNSASTTITVDDIPIRKDLTVKIFIAGTSGSVSHFLTFNGDNGAGNYGWTQIYTASNDSLASSTPTSARLNAQSKIELDTFGSSFTGAAEITMNIINSATVQKICSWQTIISNGNATPPDVIQGGCVWNNTSAAVRRIDLTVGNTANTYNAGSRITVYGSAN